MWSISPVEIDGEKKILLSANFSRLLYGMRTGNGHEDADSRGFEKRHVEMFREIYFDYLEKCGQEGAKVDRAKLDEWKGSNLEFISPTNSDAGERLFHAEAVIMKHIYSEIVDGKKHVKPTGFTGGSKYPCTACFDDFVMLVGGEDFNPKKCQEIDRQKRRDQAVEVLKGMLDNYKVSDPKLVDRQGDPSANVLPLMGAHKKPDGKQQRYKHEKGFDREGNFTTKMDLFRFSLGSHDSREKGDNKDYLDTHKDEAHNKEIPDDMSTGIGGNRELREQVLSMGPADLKPTPSHQSRVGAQQQTHPDVAAEIRDHGLDSLVGGFETHWKKLQASQKKAGIEGQSTGGFYTGVDTDVVFEKPPESRDDLKAEGYKIIQDEKGSQFMILKPHAHSGRLSSGDQSSGVGASSSGDQSSGDGASSSSATVSHKPARSRSQSGGEDVVDSNKRNKLQRR